MNEWPPTTRFDRPGAPFVISSGTLKCRFRNPMLFGITTPGIGGKMQIIGRKLHQISLT